MVVIWFFNAIYKQTYKSLLSFLLTCPKMFSEALIQKYHILCFQTCTRNLQYMHMPTKGWGAWTLNQYMPARMLWNHN